MLAALRMYCVRILMSYLSIIKYSFRNSHIIAGDHDVICISTPMTDELSSCNPPRGNHHGGHPPSSPARLPRRQHSDLLQIILEEGDPDRDSIPKVGPYAALVPPTSPWNRLGRDMIGVHTPSGSIISPTLISPKRYKWLHAAHSQQARPEAFNHGVLKLLARYHPRAKSLNPQGRKLKLANHWATMPTLQHELERTFLSDKELFGSPLNCSMSSGIS
jgi:hypothetical protein